MADRVSRPPCYRCVDAGVTCVPGTGRFRSCERCRVKRGKCSVDPPEEAEGSGAVTRREMEEMLDAAAERAAVMVVDMVSERFDQISTELASLRELVDGLYVAEDEDSEEEYVDSEGDEELSEKAKGKRVAKK